MFCSNCGQEIAEEELIVVDEQRGIYFCSEDCANKDGWWRCSKCGEWVHEDEKLHTNDGTVFCSPECAYEGNYDLCEDCGCYYHLDYIRHIENYGCVCDDCYSCGDYFQCGECGDYFEDDQAAYSDYYVTLCGRCNENYVECSCCEERMNVHKAYYDGGDYYCNNCYENIEEIHNYGYKPNPEFFFAPDESGANAEYLGVELEVDNGFSRHDLAYNISQCAEIYCKEDGSLSSSGLEIVTHPATLKYHMELMDWENIADTCRRHGFKSHDTETCGLHVHVNKSSFGLYDTIRDLNIAKTILLMDKFYESHIIKFARRDYYHINRWAGKNNLKIESTDTIDDITKKMHSNYSRYVAINLQNSQTIEFRVFRGTLNKNTIIATLQFVHVFCDFAKKIELDKIDGVKWEDIFEGCEYEELNNYLVTRKLKQDVRAYKSDNPDTPLVEDGRVEVIAQSTPYVPPEPLYLTLEDLNNGIPNFDSVNAINCVYETSNVTIGSTTGTIAI